MKVLPLMAVLMTVVLLPRTPALADAAFQVETASRTFSVPREFVPISAWSTMRIPVSRSNYFVFRVPAAYVAGRVPGFRTTENATSQDVIVAVEVLRVGAQGSAHPGKTCWRGTHDGVPESLPYDRCLYVSVLDGRWAVKYGLNGYNVTFASALPPLIDELLTAWSGSKQ